MFEHEASGKARPEMGGKRPPVEKTESPSDRERAVNNVRFVVEGAVKLVLEGGNKVVTAEMLKETEWKEKVERAAKSINNLLVGIDRETLRIYESEASDPLHEAVIDKLRVLRGVITRIEEARLKREHLKEKGFGG